MESTILSDISSSSSMTAGRCSTKDNQMEQDALLAARLAEEEVDRDRDCTSDTALAMMLQKQFDLEYDSQLKKQESKINGQSKVGVSLSNFRRTGGANTTIQGDDSLYESDNEFDTEGSFDSRVAWDVFEQSEIKQRSRMMGRSGFVLDEEGNMITKHDIPTSSRKNMCKLMELKTDIETGDAGASKDDFKITNFVYNRLKVHSKRNSRRVNQRLFDKKERDNVAILEDIQSSRMSDATRAIMDGLLIAYKIEKLNGVIGHGKESTVIHATGVDHEDNPSQEVAIKIFNTSANVAFKSRDTYNRSKCPSYKFDKPKSKNDSLNKWAERGFKNLKLLRKADINCPDAISLKKHVLVMTFLGSGAKPSPQLKDVALDESQLQSSYTQVVDIMQRMYRDCNLIHGDLSEYNLLWCNEQVYVIDVSQSMFTSHPNANWFLYRDCKNITDFYTKSGFLDASDVSILFTSVCGKELNEKDVELWAKIEDFPPNEKLMRKEEAALKRFNTTDDIGQLLDSTDDSSRVYG